MQGLITNNYLNFATTLSKINQSLKREFLSSIPLIKQEFNSDLYYKLMNDQKMNIGASLYSTASNLTRVLTLDKVILDKHQEASYFAVFKSFFEFETLSKTVVNNARTDYFQNQRNLEQCIKATTSLIQLYTTSEEKEILQIAKELLNKLNQYWSTIVHDDSEKENKELDQRSTFQKLERKQPSAAKTRRKRRSTKKKKLSTAAGANTRKLINITPNTHHQTWTVANLQELFRTYFEKAKAPSDITTSISAKKHLERILNILSDPDNPPKNTNLNNLLPTCNQMLNDAKAFPNLQRRIVNKYPDDVYRIQVVDDFYTAIKAKDSEETLLQLLRGVHSYAQKEENDSIIQEYDLSKQSAFENMLNELINNVIDKEKDSVRLIDWEYRNNYLKNLEEFKNNRYKVKPADQHPEEEDLATINGEDVFQFYIQPKTKTIYYNPNMLVCLDQIKQINYYGQFEDGKFMEVNFLSSFFMGALNHEIRGHFKHLDGDELIAQREMASRYAVPNLAAEIAFSAIQSFNITSSQSIQNTTETLLTEGIDELIEEYKKAHPPKMDAEYAELLPNVSEMAKTFIKHFIHSANYKFNKKNRINEPVPILDNFSYLDLSEPITLV